MNIHISNLNLNLIEADIQRLFSPFGEIQSIELVRDKWNHRSRGSAFVEMTTEKVGQKAVIGLNKIMVQGKIISVTEVMYNPTGERI